MKFPDELLPKDYHTVAKANRFEDGEEFEEGDERFRIAPVMPMQVDDLFSTDIIDTMRLTSAASIMALEDMFGLDHPCQEMVLSQEKLVLAYLEERLLVGFPSATREDYKNDYRRKVAPP